MCRKKKIKCDGKMPKCTHCINYKTECIFTQVEKKRNPPKGAKYIEGLENRLNRMESLLRLSGLVSESDFEKTDLGALEKRLAERSRATAAAAQQTTQTSDLWPDSGARPVGSGLHRHSSGMPSPYSRSPGRPGAESQPAVTPRLTTPRTGRSGPPSVNGSPPWYGGDRGTHSWTSTGAARAAENERQEEVADALCSLITDSCGETRYIGSSSGFSIFSPRGIQWVRDKTGDDSFQTMITSSHIDDNKWIYWKPEIFSDIFARKVFKPLPPREEALSLLRDYFENFNCVFPLFHEPTFMHLAERQYSRDPYEGSGWWASLNVVLAIAHRLRVMTNTVPHEEDKLAWLYLKNALGVLTELTTRNTDLLSVQALLGMALFLQGTPNPQPTFFLVAAAIRVAHGIGLHKRGYGFNLHPIEVEQRRRVFWIAYMLDKDICLRSGRPAVQDDDDMNVDLPSDDPPDNVGNVPLSGGQGKVNLFRVMCRFAMIASKVYRKLYSARAAQQSDGELLNIIGELDREIEEWKNSIPLDVRPEHEIKTTHPPLMIHIIILHLGYYNCLATIHRMSVHHGYWTSRLSNYAIQGLNARPLNPRVFSSAAICVQAARYTINLIKLIPDGDFSCVWLILYFPISALVTLFAHILQNPQDARARADVKLMSTVVSFLSRLATDESNGSVKRMLSVCSEFERIAKVVVEKAEREIQDRLKRGTPAGDATEASTAATPRDGLGPPGNGAVPPRARTGANGTAASSEHGDVDGMSPRTQPAGAPGNGPFPASGIPSFTGQGATPEGSAGEGPGRASSTRPSRRPSLYQPDQLQSQSQSQSQLRQVQLPPQSEQQDRQQGLYTATGGLPDERMPPIPLNPTQQPPGTPLTSTAAANGGIGLNFSSGFDPDFMTRPPSMAMNVPELAPFVPQDLWQMPMGLEWDWTYGPAHAGGTAGGSMAPFGIPEMNADAGLENPLFTTDGSLPPPEDPASMSERRPE
ncbi:hypothetical protein KEM52_000056 [Ascosphaera acerosa]|nr:hypothetical protein KEM52_000056 [Ascosphaera acerosa]